MHRSTRFGVLTLSFSMIMGSSFTFAQTDLNNSAGNIKPHLNSSEAASGITTLFAKAKTLSQFDPAAAIQAYRALITQAPNQLEAYNNLAALLAAQGKAGEATEVLEAAIQRDPLFATISENLRMLYLQQSQLHYKKALLLDTNAIEPISLATINQLDDSTNPIASIPSTMTKAATITPPNPPTPTPKLTTVTSTDNTAILAPIQSVLAAWKNTWGQRDAEAFIGHYVYGYRAKFDTPEHWQQSRHDNFNSKTEIRIEIDQVDIQPSQGNRARATFN